MLIGAHVPTTGGYRKMALYSELIGAECLQIFAKSPRQWNAKPLDKEAVETMRELRSDKNIGPVFTHTSYLINLTTDNDELREKSVRGLADELVRGSLLGAAGVNTHLGSVPDGNTSAAIVRAARAIEEAFELAGGVDAVDTVLILENTAGAGTIFGGPVGDVASVITECEVPNDKLGFCIDTCHAWAYGYDVTTDEAWEEIMSEISPVGLDRWRLVHANDCKFGIGSRKDRHEWIGLGEIGNEAFYKLLHLRDVDHLCLTTEMPGEAPQKDIVNIEALKVLRARG
jgi:deoxyribonuclease-4